jgi:hypothetical protein
MCSRRGSTWICGNQDCSANHDGQMRRRLGIGEWLSGLAEIGWTRQEGNFDLIAN